jgi:signal transduction histidine kinase
VASTDKQTRRLLLIGFGGLLSLLALSGINALTVVRKIEAQNERIREDYFNRDQILEELRSDIYLSGTYVRDLLLDQNPAEATRHRSEVDSTRRRIDKNVESYQSILRGEERAPFQRFRTELDSYFNSLLPVLDWDTAQRRSQGYEFMRTSLLPRRMMIVHLADQISDVNKRQMQAGSRQIANLFSRFQGTLVVFLFLTLVCGGLLTAGSVHSILRLERVSAIRLAEAEHAQTALHELSARLIEVQESERRALSRELHDEVGQSVSALLLGIGNVAALLPSSISEARTQLGELRLLAEKTVAVVRDMSLLLRPSMLDDLGLIPAVQWQAREVSRNNDVFVHVHADAVPEDLPDDHKTCIYRVVQEALRNAVRHAKAKSVQIDLKQRGETLLLTIRDDGQGFSPDREKGLGLLGMEERITHLHGRFHVTSQTGQGACISVELPLTEQETAVQV